MSTLRSRLPIATILFAIANMADAHNDAQLDTVLFSDDDSVLSIEQLLDVEVFTASRFPQKSSEAPSRVTVITSDDIRRYGYRTIRDALDSIAGLYSTYDNNYSYQGARGFGIPGDYNTRFLMLLDGKRVNDNIYDSFGTDYDGIVNIDLIERIEFSPGPGSAVYGANAVFGVINIITKNGEDLRGTQASVEYGSNNSRRGRVSAGSTFDNSVDALISASAYKSDGQDRYYPEFDDPTTNNGIAQELDYEQAQNFLVKLKYQDWSFSTSYNERTKGIPTASYGQAFNTKPSETIDTSLLATLTYDPVLDKHSQIFSSLSTGRYEYTGDYSYDYPPITINRDDTTGQWINAEARYQTTRFSKQKIIAGIEFQKNGRQDQANFDVDPFESYLDDTKNSRTFSIYLQDEIRLTDQLILNAGLRYDDNSIDSGDGSIEKSIVNPRLALIYSVQPQTTLKLIYGTAYRNPNAYELYYGTALGYLPSTDLQPEEIETYEINLEHYFSNNLRLNAAVYTNRTNNLIDLNSDPDTGDIFFDNIEEAEALGTDIEAEYVSNEGIRARTSYSYVDTEKKGMRDQLVNSPKNTFKLNLASPVFSNKTEVGLEFQYMSERSTVNGASVGDHGITNLTLSSEQLHDRLILSASIYNLFDRIYSDPASEEHTQNSIPQDERSFRVKLTYTF